MNKKLVIIVCVLVCLVVVFCLILGFKKGNTSSEFSKEQIISLDANPTTGYSWSYVIADESIASVTHEEYIMDDTSDELVVGRGGKKTFTLSGNKEGSTTITFDYAREFEENSTVETIVYDITVNANKEIKVVKK